MKKIFLILPIALLAAGCNYQQIDVPTNQNDSAIESSIDSKPNISGWKTYQNDKLGFKLSYPAGYTVTENPKDLPIPEDQPDAYKNTVLYLNNADSGPSLYGQIYIQKIKANYKKTVADQFDMNLVLMRKISNYYETSKLLMFDYFTASAQDSSKTYLISDYQQDSPADTGDKVVDIIIARVQASSNDILPATTTTPDWIARTIQFLK